MFGLDPLTLGILFVAVGLTILWLIRLLLRVVPRIQPTPDATTLSSAVLSLDLPASDDAVLLIQPGGKIVFANEIIRGWLNLPTEDLPNLEHLARQARPGEIFLSLCAAPGQARFSMKGLMVDGISYTIPYQESQAVLVSLRRSDLTVLTQEESSISGKALDILTELSRAMTASLDLEATLQAILESVEHLIPSDISEITVWDPNQEQLIPYGFTGLQGIDRHLEKLPTAYNPNEGYSGYIFSNRKPLLVKDVNTFREARPALDRRNFPMRSYLGVPLMIAGEPIGTLELGSLITDTFSENDQDILSILSSQAAVALKNALVHREEERRVAELTGLARLAQAAGTLRDPRDLYSHLIQSILPLLDVEILGFMIFDKTQNRLNGQVPFVGIPDHFVAMYQTEIPSNSAAEEIWLSQETILAPNAPENPKLQTLGLAHLAQATGIQNTVLTPLTLRGRSIGYIQAANKSDSTPFVEEDLRILAIVAGQAAPIIQNANLIQETRRRAQQAEALRKVAALAGSAATLDEILTFSLIEIARLLQADTASIFILDEGRYELRLHKNSLFGIAPERFGRLSRIAVDDPQFHNTVTSNQRAIAFENGNHNGSLPPFYHILTQTLQAESAVSVPLIVRDRGIGEMILGSQKENFFSIADIELASTAAGQMAGAIERSFLYIQTDETLRRRVEQLTSITRISRELNASLELRRLLRLVYNEALFNTGADCGTILLFDLNTSEPESPNIALRIGDSPKDSLLPIERAVLETEEPLVIENFTRSDFEPPHKDVLTSLIVPIAHQENIVGLIHMHARTPLRFDEEALEITQTLAVQAAIALGNAQRYHDQVQRNKLLKQGMNTLTKLLATNQALRRNQTVEQSLNSIAGGIQETTPFDVVLISVYDEDEEALVRTSHAGIGKETMQELQSHTVPWRLMEELLKPEFRIQHSYFIPEDKLPVVPPDIHTVTLLSTSDASSKGNAWRPGDLFFAPLFNDNQAPLGLISVDAPRDGLRPDHTTIDTLEIFATQAALTIERHQRINSLENRVHILQDEVERAQEASQTAQSHLPFLLRKDLEQTISIQRLNLRSRRIQAALEIVEAVNRQDNRDSVFRALGREMIARMSMDIILIAEPSPRGPVLTHTLGKIPEDTNPQALIGQRNPLRRSLRTNTPIFVANMADRNLLEWQNSPLLRVLKTESFICLPIQPVDTSNTSDAVALGISRVACPEFTAEDQQIFTLIAHQIAIALQNLNLLDETRQRLKEVDLLLDFSRQLGSLNPDEIMRTLVDSTFQAITHAHSTMIALWDQKAERLVPQAASGYKNNQLIMEIAYRMGEALPGQVFASGVPRRVGEVDFARDYNLSAENLLRYREATDGYVPISSLLIPIKAGDATLGVMVLDNFGSPSAFTEEDQALVSSLTQQTGLILENARLFQAADQRAIQLQTLTDVSTTITSNLQVGAIIASLLEQFETIIPFDTGTLWLRQGDTLTIRAVQGFEDSEERFGLEVAIEDSQLFNEMIASGQAINVTNVHDDPRFSTLIAYSRLSWLGIPLIAKGEVVGVIALEETEAEFYTPEHVQAATTFAGQAAVALENARLFEDSVQRTEELNRRTQRLDLLNWLSTEFSSSLDPEYILTFTAAQLHQAIYCSAVSAISLDDKGNAHLVAESPPFETRLPVSVNAFPLTEYLRETLGVFIARDITTESILAPLTKFLMIRNTRSLLAFPLFTGTELHGLLLVHEDRQGFQPGEIELVNTISNQAAVALGNARLFERTQFALADLEIRERYQKSVAQAVALLTERGTQALPEVLQIMGEAAQVSRVYYFEVLEDEEGPYWRQVAEWCNAGVSLQIDNPELQHFPTSVLPDWVEELRISGIISGVVRMMPSPQKEILEAQDIFSILILAVPGTNAIPGFVGFDEITYERGWRTDEIAALQTVAAALSSTIAQENLFTRVQEALSETEEQARRLTLLNEMSNQLSRAANVDEILNITASISTEVLGADRASIAVFNTDHDTFTVFALRGLVGAVPVGSQIPLKRSSAIQRAVAQNQIVVVQDSENTGIQGIHSFMIAPLYSQNVALGTINVGNKLPHSFTPSDQNILLQIASLVSATIENKNLLEETQRLTEELEERVLERTEELEIEHNRTQTLLGIITELSASLDMDIVLNRTLALINKIVDAEQSTIMLSQSAGTHFLRRASYGYTSPTPAGGEVTRLPLNEGVAGWVIANRKPALIPDILKDDRWVQTSITIENPGEHRSAIAVPLMIGEEVLGALLLFHHEPNHFSNDKLDLIQATAQQIAVAINNAKLYHLIRDQAERLGSMLRTQQVEASRLRGILEAVVDGVLVTDASGTIFIFNASAEKILGLTDTQVVGKSLENFTGLFGKAGQTWTDTIRAWSDDPTTYETGDTYSEQIDLDDGHVVAVSLAPVASPTDFLGTVSIFRDITHQVEVDRLKSEFVATVSHELRTPMTSVRGYVDILLMGAAGPLNEQQTNFLKVVQSNTERLNVLVNDLLDVSRIEAGKVTLSMQIIELFDVANEIVTDYQLRSQEENKSMQIEIYSPKTKPRVHGDSERIRQILDNLIGNAYNYTPAGGRVSVHLAIDDNFVQVDIKDDGIGIAPEDQKRIFERFYRGEDPLVLATAGTGLGLSIVQYLIELHGGRIWVESRGVPGDGSTFSFTLPVYVPED